MPIWKLTPIDLDDPNWEASSHRRLIVVRAPMRRPHARRRRRPWRLHPLSARKRHARATLGRGIRTRSRRGHRQSEYTRQKAPPRSWNPPSRKYREPAKKKEPGMLVEA